MLGHRQFPVFFYAGDFLGGKIEAEIDRLATRDESLERRINALESREDEVYRKWREKYHKLRYEPPAVTVLFEAIFQLSPQIPETSC